MGAIPWPLRVVIGNLAYRQVVAALHGQGTGRLTPEEIASARREVLDSLAGLLAASRAKKSSRSEVFWALGGDAPTEADASLFGSLAATLVCESGPEARRLVKGYPVLMDYVERIHDRYFPDYEKWDT